MLQISDECFYLGAGSSQICRCSPTPLGPSSAVSNPSKPGAQDSVGTAVADQSTVLQDVDVDNENAATSALQEDSSAEGDVIAEEDIVESVGDSQMSRMRSSSESQAVDTQARCSASTIAQFPVWHSMLGK